MTRWRPPRQDNRALLWAGLVVVTVLVIWLYIVLSATVFRADAAPAKAATVTQPGYAVGEFQEPPQKIQTRIQGRETIRLEHQWLPGRELVVPVEELKLIAPRAVQTKLGACAGNQAVRQGNARTRNRVFLRQWRVACAAFTAFCARRCGRPGLSFRVTTQYAQLRKRGARIVASKVSTRYAPYYPYFKRGDYLFFHKSGGRMGHVEICVGGGWTVGTSSSAGYVARRRTGNRGFRTMSVLRL